MSGRHRVLFYVFIVWAAAIVMRLVWLEVIHYADYAAAARREELVAIDVPSVRGTIYDRHGQLLAISLPVGSAYLNPLKLPDRALAADLLSKVLYLDQHELYRKIQEAYQRNRGFVWVKRRMPPDEEQRLLGLRLDWVGIIKESDRHYPSGLLAAHILGGVDDSEQGIAGVELSLDAALGGKPGRMLMLTDAKRRKIESQTEVQPKPGTPITLTIEQRVQHAAERALAAAVESHHAARGSVVAMDPRTGDILALASYPTYDPNLPAEVKSDTAWQNHAISGEFEPGAVFEVVTFSAALETTRLRPDSPFDCVGQSAARPATKGGPVPAR